jgi:ATP-dependent Clp protease ATP-binding subunit ClpC
MGTEHLLLGILREGEGLAVGVLENLGVDLEKVRSDNLKIMKKLYSLRAKTAPSRTASASRLRTDRLRKGKPPE